MKKYKNGNANRVVKKVSNSDYKKFVKKHYGDKMNKYENYPNEIELIYACLKTVEDFIDKNKNNPNADLTKVKELRDDFKNRLNKLVNKGDINDKK